MNGSATAWPKSACPQCSASLRTAADTLSCPQGHSFPIVGGIPRFVAGATYADAFGEQWKKHRRTQLDSYTGTTITADRLRRCLGDELWDSLTGRHVLECGCGAGRFTEILLARRARVTSVDLSSAVEANRDNFPLSDDHRIAQADILKLPFQLMQFDVVLCLGVVQHTRDPERTIEALFSHVRPGGFLVIDHYAPSVGWRLSIKPLVRAILRRLPPGSAFTAVSRMVDLFLPLHRAARTSRPAQLVLGRISPVMHYYHQHPLLPEETQHEWALLDTHDSLTDWYKHRRSVAQIRQVLLRLGLENVWCTGGGIGVEARGRRP